MTPGNGLTIPQTGDAVALFLGLYLGHILGDFVFQPGRLVIAKREHFSAAVLHSAIVTACQALALAAVLPRAWPTVVVAGIAHLAVEQLSINARRVPGATGLAVFLLDQGLHIVSLAVIAAVAGIAVEATIGVWPSSLAVLGAVCGITTVAFGGSILVFEVQVLRARPEGEADPILRLDAARIYGIAERGSALAAALLLPVPLLGALAFVPRVVHAVAGKRADRTRQYVAVAVGGGLTLVAWALVASLIRLAH
jgi:hypothetical protein